MLFIILDLGNEKMAASYARSREMRANGRFPDNRGHQERGPYRDEGGSFQDNRENFRGNRDEFRGGRGSFRGDDRRVGYHENSRPLRDDRGSFRDDRGSFRDDRGASRGQPAGYNDGYIEPRSRGPPVNNFNDRLGHREVYRMEGHPHPPQGYSDNNNRPPHAYNSR